MTKLSFKLKFTGFFVFLTCFFFCYNQESERQFDILINIKYIFLKKNGSRV
jgi:hypothetical protein